VGKTTPTITTSATSATLGGSVSDTATLAGGQSPTGTITFRLFGPNNASCAGTPVFTSTVAVNGNGTYPSASFKPTAVGTYRFVVSYSGDANNAATSSACGAANESVVVTRATPGVVTHASPSAPLGGTVKDTAAHRTHSRVG
jgi:hypothetical protein